MQLSQRLPNHRRMERELDQPLPLDQRRAAALDSRKNTRDVLDALEVPMHGADGRVVVGAEEAVDGVVAGGDDGDGERGAEGGKGACAVNLLLQSDPVMCDGSAAPEGAHMVAGGR